MKTQCIQIWETVPGDSHLYENMALVEQNTAIFINKSDCHLLANSEIWID